MNEFQSAFAERFELAEFDEQSVLLDLNTGFFYLVNRSALGILSRLRRGEQVDPADVTSVLGQLQKADDFAGTPEVAIETHRDGFRLRSERAVISFDKPSGSLCFETDPHLWMYPPATYVRLAAFHLLALNGIAVLHASAVSIEDSIVAFSGRSGAGKTTMAQVFRDAGASIVSSDALFIQIFAGVPIGWLEGERRLGAWVIDKSAILETGARVNVDDLNARTILVGDTEPVREILFLDAVRRDGDDIKKELVVAADALVLVLERGLIVSNPSGVWQRLLRFAERLSQLVPIYRSTVPNGLDRLANAARDYISNTTS